MDRQKSFNNETEACLYIVATPIGNLEDITLRALRILKEVDIIYAEDTRVTRVLLSHYEIKKPLQSYYEFNDNDKTINIINDLIAGKKIALVSDAGMPLISDPGNQIIKKCIEKNFKVIVIPGVNAALSGLVVSGLKTQPFIFLGFLSNKKTIRKKELTKYINTKETLIIYESIHRIKEFLIDVLSVFGNRRIVIAREITKKFEEIIRGNVSEILEIINELKGELVIIIEGQTNDDYQGSLSITEHVDVFIKEGLLPREAIKQVALARKMRKQEIYNAYHKKI